MNFKKKKIFTYLKKLRISFFDSMSGNPVIVNAMLLFSKRHTRKRTKLSKCLKKNIKIKIQS